MLTDTCMPWSDNEENDDWLSETVSDRYQMFAGNWNRAEFQNILSTSSINQLGSKRADWDVTDTGMPWSNDDPWQVVTVEWCGRTPNIYLLTSFYEKSLEGISFGTETVVFWDIPGFFQLLSPPSVVVYACSVLGYDGR